MMFLDLLQKAKKEVSLTATTSDMDISDIEKATMANISEIEKQCTDIRVKIDESWKRLREIKSEFENELAYITEVEAMIETRLEELSNGRNANAMLPAELESNIKALHIKSKRGRHSKDVLSKIIDEGADANDLPMIATHPLDKLGMEADGLLIEIERFKKELALIEASLSI